jgi:mono/diheme cytochrome c family protein
MNGSTARIGFVALFSLASLFLCSASVRAQNDGAGLFKAKCAACHGADGSANTAVGKSMKIRDFHSPDVQKQTDAQLTDIITTGKGAMPAYKGKLTDDQVKQLVGFIRDVTKK